MKITGALLIASAAAKCGNYACVNEISASGCTGTCNQVPFINEFFFIFFLDFF